MTHNTEKVQQKKIISVPNKYYCANKLENAQNKKETNKRIKLEHVYITKKPRTKKMFTTAAALVGCMVFALLASSYTLGYTVGYTVTVDDTVVGAVATKDEYYEVLDAVKTEVRDIADMEFEPDGEEAFHAEIMKKENLTEKEELAENLKATSDEMVQAGGIFCNGELFAALPTEEDANTVLTAYLNEFIKDAENMTAEFAQEVVAAPTHIPQNAIENAQTVLQKLQAGKVISHTVIEEETLDGIAERYGTTSQRILEDNPQAKGTDFVGITLAIYTDEPIFSVKTVEHINGKKEIPFEIVSTQDPNVYEGTTKIDVAGVKGEKFVEAYVTKIDGALVEETILKDELISEPVTQVQRVGTKERPASVGTGAFAMPTSGKLTSPYGARWGRKHAGIDLGAATGTPIYAADNGIVKEAQFKNNGYGNLICIDHGNGFVTYYAHCSKITVSEGDVVAKGDLIGNVGSTGRSTGPHLHFEIRKDGESQNPMQYIK